LQGSSQRDAQSEAAMMMNRAEAQRRAETALQDLWVARESVEFCVQPGIRVAGSVSNVTGSRNAYKNVNTHTAISSSGGGNTVK
jgi:Putative phage tail protein